ncbi:MAG: ABC transporter ATP-binding protein [Chloroflexi bacterium]|nr:ABC transporter ATP-binding protein [Chloroflexota bacterium]
MDPLIVASDLHKSFGSTHAVKGVSLSVRAGEAYGLVGPDGAGKTTTMRLLVGALSPDAGTAQVGGFDLQLRTEEARAGLGYLPQRFSLYGDLTVVENLQFFAQVRGVGSADFVKRAAELFKFVGLEGFEHRRADQLSGGMKQKLGLACALVHQPKVLLLDEPTGGVDPVTRQDFWQLIIRLLTEGTAVIISTPYMDEAARCSRIGFMHTGRLLVEGTLRELTASMAGRVLELAAHPKDTVKRTALADPDVEDVLTFGDRFHLRVKEAAGPLARLPGALAEAGATVERLRSVPPALEDVFISLLASSAKGN